MKISETPDNGFMLPKAPNTNPAASCGANLRFIKDEQGNRVAQELSASDVAEMKKKQATEWNEEVQQSWKIGVIIVGHIGHTKAQIIEILSRRDLQDIKGSVILVANTEDTIPGMPVALWLEYLQEKLQDLDREKPFIIKASPREVMPEIFLEKKDQRYNDFTTRYVPKTQKSKASNVRKPGTRKK
jgi:hypothetical protein